MLFFFYGLNIEWQANNVLNPIMILKKCKEECWATQTPDKSEGRIRCLGVISILC
jgi:hypothetical protein